MDPESFVGDTLGRRLGKQAFGKWWIGRRKCLVLLRCGWDAKSRWLIWKIARVGSSWRGGVCRVICGTMKHSPAWSMNLGEF